MMILVIVTVILMIEWSFACMYAVLFNVVVRNADITADTIL